MSSRKRSRAVAVRGELCAICQDDVNITNRKILDCRHEFCGDCLQQWAEITNACPVCRKAIDSSQPIRPARVNVDFSALNLPSLQAETFDETFGSLELISEQLYPPWPLGSVVEDAKAYVASDLREMKVANRILPLSSFLASRDATVKAIRTASLRRSATLRESGEHPAHASALLPLHEALWLLRGVLHVIHRAEVAPRNTRGHVSLDLLCQFRRWYLLANTRLDMLEVYRRAQCVFTAVARDISVSHS